MIVDSANSIIEGIKINKGRLEGYISVGMKKAEILSAFNMATVDMNNWCMENYGMNFDTVFEVVRQVARGEYLDCLKELGVRGNPTAMSIIDKFVNNDDAGGNSGISFNVNVKMENSDDKKCDGTN